MSVCKARTILLNGDLFHAGDDGVLIFPAQMVAEHVVCQAFLNSCKGIWFLCNLWERCKIQFGWVDATLRGCATPTLPHRCGRWRLRLGLSLARSAAHVFGVTVSIDLAIPEPLQYLLSRRAAPAHKGRDCSALHEYLLASSQVCLNLYKSE